MNVPTVVKTEQGIAKNVFWFVSLEGLYLNSEMIRKLAEVIEDAAKLQRPHAILISLVNISGYDDSCYFGALVAEVAGVIQKSCQGTRLAFIMADRAVQKVKGGKLDRLAAFFLEKEVAIANHESWPAP